MFCRMNVLYILQKNKIIFMFCSIDDRSICLYLYCISSFVSKFIEHMASRIIHSNKLIEKREFQIYIEKKIECFIYNLPTIYILFYKRSFYRPLSVVYLFFYF